MAGDESAGGERGAEQLHAVAGEQSRIALGGTGLFGGAEEVFHLAGGGEGNEQVAGRVAGIGEGMRQVARTEDRIAGVEWDALIANLDKEFPLHDVEVFLLGVVDVEGRATAFAKVGVLDEEEGAGGFARQDFEGNRAEADGVVFVQAVLAAGDSMGFGAAGGTGLAARARSISVRGKSAAADWTKRRRCMWNPLSW